MKKILGLVFLVLIGISIYYFFTRNSNRVSPQSAVNDITQNKTNPADIPRTAVIAENLDTPWGMVFLPDNSILVTERHGTVRKISPEGVLRSEPITTLTNVREISEGGLLGIDIHPDFSNNNYVYLYYTYSGSGNNTLNRVVRMTYSGDGLDNETVIVDSIPGAPNHNGGRIKFGPDNNLYIATGDAQEPSLAQNTNSLAGKILRVNDNGQPVSGNSFNNRVYSYGHRNVQGLSWDTSGLLWATEHGKSAPSGFDELNLIKIGLNYGWPDIEGSQEASGMITPVINSGANDTWAPAGAAIVDGSIYFAGLRGEALYKSDLNGENALNLTEYFGGEFGRLRDVVKGPDNMLYITTSNRDGRGTPDSTDDKIIRINPQKL